MKLTQPGVDLCGLPALLQKGRNYFFPVTAVTRRQLFHTDPPCYPVSEVIHPVFTHLGVAEDPLGCGHHENLPRQY